jgi:hypothetical protein
LSLPALSRSWFLPLVLALLFVAVPPLLFRFYPIPFWTAGEAELIGLGDALNLAYRIADIRMYSAIGMWDHPGVPFYFMSWLALALSGLPVAYSGEGFLNAVFGRLGEYQAINIWLAAIAGAAGVFIFTREARKLVPLWVIAAGLLIWIASTPWTLIAFVSPSNESFGLLINALFFCALVQVANDEAISPRVTIFAAGVGAFAYLNKLSFIYVFLTLAGVGVLSMLFRRSGIRKSLAGSALFAAVFVGGVLFVGFFIIGWNEFLHALRFHKNIMVGTGLYGSGDQTVVASSQLLLALKSIPIEKVYCLAIAPVAGLVLVAGGFLTAAFRGKEQLPTALISIGTGTAAVLAAASVLKHYHGHYTPAVSPTLPACMVAGYMLASAWNFRPRMIAAVVSFAAIVLMMREITPVLADHLNVKISVNTMAMADLKDIEGLPIDGKSSIAFTYSAPFSYLGEGFSLYNASVPRLTAEYHRNRPRMFSTLAPDSPPRKIGAVVIHKAYFPTVESIRSASDLAKFGGEPLTWQEGDRIVDLRTVFVLLPKTVRP